VSPNSTSATASAPATTANLGPAFDCMALGIEMRCIVKASQSEQWEVDHVGRFRPSGDEDDGVLSAARAVIGEDRPLLLQVDSDIPIGKGLGSSAAAAVAGIAAALRTVGDEPDPDHVYRLASTMEGHSDNVAAAVYGGLTLVPAEGMPIRLPIHPSLRIVVAVPDRSLPTGEARQVVEQSHPHDRVLRSLSRVAALTAGLITGDPALLGAAHGDEIHELPRDAISPEVGRLIDVGRTAGALHAARSGAGPAVMAICHHDDVDSVAAAYRQAGVEALTPHLATTGLV
jgi:homoserine kinase